MIHGSRIPVLYQGASVAVWLLEFLGEETKEMTKLRLLKAPIKEIRENGELLGDGKATDSSPFLDAKLRKKLAILSHKLKITTSPPHAPTKKVCASTQKDIFSIEISLLQNQTSSPAYMHYIYHS